MELHNNLEKYVDAQYRIQDIMPIIGFGTWKLTGKRCVKSTQHALKLGYRHIDTAQAYDNEEDVGKGIRQSGVHRDQIFVTTKISTPNLHPGGISGSTANSLMHLKTDYIDLLLIHWPIDEMDLKACLETMFELQDKGQVKHVGVSNFSPALFRQAMGFGPVLTNQVKFTPLHQEMKNLELAQSKGRIITAYSPLEHGDIHQSDTLATIGKRHGKSAEQVSLRWLIQLGQVAVIPKAEKEVHRIENMDIFNFELSDDEMNQIKDLAR